MPEALKTITIDGIEYELHPKAPAPCENPADVDGDGVTIARLVQVDTDPSYDYLTKNRRYHP